MPLALSFASLTSPDWLLLRKNIPVRISKYPAKKIPHTGGGVFSWWLLPDSNWGHAALQAAALPTELKSHRHGMRTGVLYDTSAYFTRGEGTLH